MHFQHSSPLLHLPSTPVSSHGLYPPLGFSHRPINSSPLASPGDSPRSSPVAAAQLRRRSQYKSRTPSTPFASTSRTPGSVRAPSLGGGLFGGGRAGGGAGAGSVSEEPHKTFLRERFKARCFERAAKARDKAIRGKRYGAASESGSDGFDEAMDEDGEEDEDDIMQDELFRRIMENSNSKIRHGYRLSYADEVGSSFDPDMEDVSGWEHELIDPVTSQSPSTPQPPRPQPELTPEDLEDEELAAYAEECTRRAALEDFEGLLDDDLLEWSDMDDFRVGGEDSANTDMDVAN